MMVKWNNQKHRFNSKELNISGFSLVSVKAADKFNQYKMVNFITISLLLTNIKKQNKIIAKAKINNA